MIKITKGEKLQTKDTFRRRRLCAGAAIAAIAASAGAHAHAAEQPPAPSASTLEEVIVTARKTSENILDVPVSVTAVSSTELREKSIQSIADLQRLAPSLTSNYSSRSDDNVRFTIRGQSLADITLTADPSNGVYVDGAYQARTYGLRAGLYDVERVEVLNGPQGTLYGKNNTGGNVNIFTHAPDLNGVGGYLRLNAGSWQTYGAQGAINVPLASWAALRFAANYEDNHGYAHTAVNRQGDHTNKAGRLRLRLQPMDDLRIDLEGSWTRYTSGGVFFKSLYYPGTAASTFAARILGVTPDQAFAYLQAVGGSGDTRKYANNGTRGGATAYEGWDAGATIEWQALPSVLLKYQTYYKGFQRKSSNDLDNTPLPYFETATYTRDTTFMSQEFQATGQLFNDRLKYATGFYYSREGGFEGSRSEVQNPANPPLNAADLINKSYGLYGQGTFEITDQISATAGVRRTTDKKHVHAFNYRETARYSEVFFNCTVLAATTPKSQCFIDGDTKQSNTSYNLSLQYKPQENLSFYATTRRGYRAGGFNIATSGGVGLAPFQPEKVTDFEVGAKAELFDRKLRTSLAAYKSDYKNIQKSTVVVFPTGISSTLIRNAAEATIKGFEAQFDAAPTPELRVDGYFTYTDAGYDDFVVRNQQTGAIIQDRTSEPFEVPKYAFALGAKYTWADVAGGDLSARVDWNWRDTVILSAASAILPTETRLRQKAYSLVGARVEWASMEGGWRAALVGRNLFDKYYWIQGQEIRAQGFDFTSPGEPRFIGIELTKSFGGG